MPRNIKEDYKRAYGWFRYESHWSDSGGDYYNPPKKLEYRSEEELLELSPAAIGAAYITWFIHGNLIDWLQRRYRDSYHNWIVCLDRKVFAPTKTYFLDLLKEKRSTKYYKTTPIEYGDPEWKPSKEWNEKIKKLRSK